ncbi:MAG TPA: hypothetical protein VFU55_13640 [Terracidiphilus sp.]|nr:hypothetical protein [Terracidiphilus sp.]
MSPNQSTSLPARNNPGDNPASVPRRVPPHDSFTSKFLGLFSNEERRVSEHRGNRRISNPPLRAYLGVFGSTEPIPVGNISSTGFYLRTTNHWMPGTNMPLRLERTDKPGFAALHCVAVPTRVVRSDHYGVGFTFVFKEVPSKPRKPTTEAEAGWMGARWADRQTIEALVAELEASPTGQS